jgi:NADPH-dependent 2,4-dienoyl-CoA reductase/sulfur reductase-like enzyme
MDLIISLVRHLIWDPLLDLYWFIQFILDKIFSPTPPPPNANLSRPKIAVIGAGLTGVSAASHFIGHGFDTTIFEAGDEHSVGGIWTVSSLSRPSRTELSNKHKYRG